MNAVVKRTVSQSHVAVAVGARLSRRTAAQGDLRCAGGLLAREAEGASMELEPPHMAEAAPSHFFD